MQRLTFYICASAGPWLLILGLVAPAPSILALLGLVLCGVAASIVGSVSR